MSTLSKPMSVRGMRLVAIMAAAGGLALSGCGKSSSSSASSTTATTAAPASTSTSAAATGLKAELTGPADVPPGAPGGSGSAKLKLEPTQGRICYDISVANIGAATAAHIHRGAAGVAGPVVVPLKPPAAGHINACTTASQAVIDEIIANPPGFYVNVHTAAYPGGAVRGQLAK